MVRTYSFPTHPIHENKNKLHIFICKSDVSVNGNRYLYEEANILVALENQFRQQNSPSN